MKKRIFKSLIVILPLILSLSACDFVKFVEDPTYHQVITEDDNALQEQKDTYIQDISSLSSDSLYKEKERALYLQYLIEAKSEINECNNLEDLRAIYEKYEALILGLKTKEEYEKELSDMKAKYINLLASVSSEDNYREKELAVYQECIKNANELFNSLKQANEEVFAQIYNIYKEAILKLKTDEEYSKEEKALADKKEEYINKIKDVCSEDLFREAELDILHTYIEKASELINSLVDIEDDNYELIYETYKAAILKIKTKAQYEKEEKELADEKDKYLELLNNVSAVSNYREKEQKLYLFYLESGVTAIQDETNINNIKTIYETYKTAIEGVKTNAEYEVEEAAALAKYKLDNIEVIENHLDTSLYREAEVNLINGLIAEYKTKINAAEDNKTIDSLVTDYKIEAYQFKTDAEYYQEELDALIHSSVEEIRDYKNVSEYRDNEVMVINQIIDSFNEQVVDCKTKEAVNLLVSSSKQVLDSVKSDKTLYEEERLALINNAYNELLLLAGESSMSEQDYLAYCDSVKEAMLLLETKEEIKSKLSLEKQELYEPNAMLGDLDSLFIWQELVAENLNNYLQIDLYRAEQQAEIASIINSQGRLIKHQDNYSDTIDCLNNAHDLLDAVLTNDQVWAIEDAQFIADLHTLFGEDILTPPTSLSVANNYDELARIIDYHAFYQLDSTSFVRNKFRVKLNWEHKDATYEKREVYWYSELIIHAVGLKVSMENKDYLLIELIPYDFSSINAGGHTDKKENVAQYYHDGVLETRANDFDDFKYKLIATKQVVCWNSQQLWYALENDYIPLCVADSKADLIFEEAKRILRTVVKEGMSDLQKIFEIYKWCGENWHHDYSFFGYWESSDLDEYPDEGYSLVNSAHAEGGILDKTVVCCGAAKGFLILLKIEGIECLRIVGEHPLLYEENTINGKPFGTSGSHEVVFIHLDDVWYYCDPLAAAIELNTTASLYRMLTPYTNIPWPNKMHADLRFKTPFDPSMYDNIKYNDKNIYITNEDELVSIINDFVANTEGKCLTLIYNMNEFDAHACYLEHFSYEYKLAYWMNIGEICIYS